MLSSNAVLEHQVSWPALPQDDEASGDAAQDGARDGAPGIKSQNAISLRRIGKKYQESVALGDINLDVQEGEFLAIVGPSGCGKSTLLKIIAGLDEPTAGELLIKGRPSIGLEPRERDIAMVFQTYALYPHMTAAQNIALPLRMRRMRRWQRLPGMALLSPSARKRLAEIKTEVGAIAGSLGIAELLHRKPSQLSGGQRQRVAVARAMIRHPAVFLMDEPLSNLDAKLRVEMRREIASLHRRLGITFVYVTHDQSEAMTLADRVAVMVDGAFLQVAPPRDLYADPTHLEVARFVGTPTINCIPAEATAPGTIDVLGTSVSCALIAPAGTPVTACIRPEHVFVARGAEPAIDASVISIEDHGADLFARVLVAREHELTLRASPADLGGLRNGQAIRIRLAGEHVLLFDAEGRRIRAGRRAAVAR